MRRRVHPLPLSLFLANSAIFAFKKKGKGAEAEDLPDGLGEIDFDDGLKLTEDGDLDFGGGSPDPGASDDLDEIHMGLPDDLPADTGTPKKKIDEMNATISDIQDQLERNDMQVKGVRNDIDNLKTEMVQINESIKKMLSVYEAVSREYNPFVNGNAAPERRKDDNTKLFGGTFSTQEDEADMVIKPDGTMDRMVAPAPQRSVRSPEPLEKEPARPLAAPKRSSAGDPFSSECMNRISQMVELLNEKERTDQAVERVYFALIDGSCPDPKDLAYLEEWFTRLRR